MAKILKKFAFVRNGRFQSFSQEVNTDKIDEETGLAFGDIKIHDACPHCGCEEFRIIPYTEQVVTNKRKGLPNVVICNSCEADLDGFALNHQKVGYKEKFDARRA